MSLRRRTPLLSSCRCQASSSCSSLILATKSARSLFCSTFLSAFLIRVSSIITPASLLSLNKHQQSRRECFCIPHARHLGVGFFWDVSLTSDPALFKRLLC